MNKITFIYFIWSRDEAKKIFCFISWPNKYMFNAGYNFNLLFYSYFDFKIQIQNLS